jgi:hypothetical protein
MPVCPVMDKWLIVIQGTTYIDLHIKYPLFLVDINQTLVFWTDFKKILEYFVKIRPLGTELFHAYRQTDMTKLVVAFCNFSYALKVKL